MKKLIYKYLKGNPIRVAIQNEDPTKRGEWGYVYVDKNGRSTEFDPDTGQIAVHRGSPNGPVYWTTKADTTTDYRNNVPSYDQSVPFENPKNRELIRQNKEIERNNSDYYLWLNAGDEILKDWQLDKLKNYMRRFYYDSSGNRHDFPLTETGMSGADPIGKFYLEGLAFGKALNDIDKLSKLVKIRKSNIAKDNITKNNIITTRLEDYDPQRKVSAWKNYRELLKNGNILKIDDITLSPDLYRRAVNHNFIPLFTVKFNDVRDFAEITKQRLTNLGIDITKNDPIDIEYTPKGTGRGHYNNIELFINLRTSLPVHGGYYKRGNVSGTNYTTSNFVTTSFEYPLNTIVSTGIHELNGHNTEQIIERNPELLKMYLGFLDSLYSNTTYKNKTSASKNWNEFRATLLEYVYKIYSELPNKLKSSLSEFDSFVDNLDETSILDTLKDISAYGFDYSSAISESSIKPLLIREFKDLLKIAPSIIGIGMLTNNK